MPHPLGVDFIDSYLAFAEVFFNSPQNLAYIQYNDLSLYHYTNFFGGFSVICESRTEDQARDNRARPNHMTQQSKQIEFRREVVGSQNAYPWVLCPNGLQSFLQFFPDERE